MIEFQSNQPEPTSLDLTPLIDVVFQLLVFFLLTSAFISTGITVELPDAETGESGDDTTLAVSIDADGAIFVQGETRDRDSLLALLRTAAQRDPETPVTIRGNRTARHEAVVGVMDACGTAGLYNLSVGTTASEEG